jgi:hypothetical protein
MVSSGISWLERWSVVVAVARGGSLAVEVTGAKKSALPAACAASRVCARS